MALTRVIKDESFTDIEITVSTPVRGLGISFHTAEDSRPRPLGIERFHMPFAVPLKGESGMERVIPEIEGGDWARGRDLFFGKVACFTCHVIRGEGHAVGPDLSNTPHRDYVSVLRDIIDPNATINPDAVGYLFTLKEGEQVVVGTRVGETESEIKVASAGGVETIVKKSDIDSVESLSASLMPVGFLAWLIY